MFTPKTNFIYAHPWEKSYNHAILTTIIEKFEKNNEEFQLIDLYQDGFNPVYTPAELKLFSQGETNDVLVKEYQKKLTDTDELIFIFPIWWMGEPAIVKGFIDRVMLTGFAYEEDEELNWTPLLTHIKRTTVLTTSTATKEYLETIGGDAIQRVFIDGIFAHIGLKNDCTKWVHLGQANLTTDDERREFLASVTEII